MFRIIMDIVQMFMSEVNSQSLTCTSFRGKLLQPPPPSTPHLGPSRCVPCLRLWRESALAAARGAIGAPRPEDPGQPGRLPITGFVSSVNIVRVLLPDLARITLSQTDQNSEQWVGLAWEALNALENLTVVSPTVCVFLDLNMSWLRRLGRGDWWGIKTARYPGDHSPGHHHDHHQELNNILDKRRHRSSSHHDSGKLMFSKENTIAYETCKTVRLAQYFLLL